MSVEVCVAGAIRSLPPKQLAYVPLAKGVPHDSEGHSELSPCVAKWGHAVYLASICVRTVLAVSL